MKIILKYGLALILSVLATFYSKYDLNILLTIPVLAFFMFNGIHIFTFSFAGLAIGSAINYLFYDNYISFIYLLIALTIFFITHFIQLLFNKKLLINFLISTTSSIILTYLIYMIFNNLFDIKNFLVILLLTSIIAFLFAYITKGFSLHLLSYNNKESKLLTYCALILYSSLFNQIFDNYYLTLIIILILFVLFSFKESIVNTLALNSLVIIFSFLFNINILSECIQLYLPISICIAFNKSKNQYLNSLLVLTCFIMIYLIFTVDDIIYYLILSAVITLFTLFIKYKEQNNIENKYYLQYVNNKNEILHQLNNFKEMFITLSDNFTNSYKSKILYRAKQNVFDKFCLSCSNYDTCSNKGKHLLLNYLKEYLNNNIDDNKERYIKQNCIKQDAYFKLLENFTQSYLLKQYEEEVEVKSKKVIANDFYSFSKVMEHTYKSFSNDRLVVQDNFFKNIKKSLEEYGFDVLFVNDVSSNSKYCFNIAIKNISKREIYSILLPVIEQMLNTKMQIDNIDNATLNTNYFIISIIEKEKIKISYAIKQSNEDIKANGDSYASLIDDKLFYLALSDGMGHGINANEESKFAIDILFSMLKSKLDIEESIKLTNNIIQLKNDYDSYATMDLIAIDSQTNVCSFYKFGATNAYIIRNNNPNEINNFSLPLGIIEKISFKPSSYYLEKGDIIIMFTDGMVDDNNLDISNILENICSDDSPTVICNVLFSQLINIRQNFDDATLAVIKIN